MPFRALKDTSVTDVNGDSQVHAAGTVLSEWEISDWIKGKITEGSLHYRSLFEPLTDNEAREERLKDTALEGDHLTDGHHVSAPYDDYVGLNAADVIERMRLEGDRAKVALVRLYEKGGLGRSAILEYVAPCERPPFYGYDDMGVREVIEKLEVLSPDSVQEVISYEMAHRKRPAIITYEPASTEKEEVTA